MTPTRTAVSHPTPLSEDALLKAILSEPTAPFREGHVVRILLHELVAARVPHFRDPIGNIVVGASSRAEYLKLVRTRSKEPVRVFIAHMDHPGFHGVEWKSPTRLEIKWHGGSPTQLLDGAPVWLADDLGWLGEGHLRDVKLLASGRAIESAVVDVQLHDRREGRTKTERIFGGFRFRAPFWEEDRVIYTKAADDLIGTFAITTLAKELFKKRKAGVPFLGLLTRAEEVGFIGAIGHFELGWLEGARRPLLCVSLETSRTLPGAEIGKGPVVRLGDRFGVFDPTSLHAFSAIAEKRLPGRHQKRIMDGGTCEATAAVVYGHAAVGISVPLGNYHNQSFQGGPDSAGQDGPAPEFVHRDDIDGMLELCRGLMDEGAAWTDPFGAKRKEFRGWVKKYQPLLKLDRAYGR